jgi:mono/diheme cytochrome c family protein
MSTHRFSLRPDRRVWLALAASLGVLSVSNLSAQNAVSAPAPAAGTNTAPTYLRDVRPILMGNCSRCHNESSRFVYDWLDYRTAYADRWELKRRVWDSYKNTYYKEVMPVANSPESIALSEEDRLTIKQWVESGSAMGTTPVGGGAQNKTERIQAGRKLFNSICTACHQAAGQGRPNVFPPLAGSDYLNADKNRAIQFVLFGRQGEVMVNGVKYNNNMPAFPLSDENIANVLTYIYNSFGNSGLEVKPDEVKALRATPPKVVNTPALKSNFE